MNKSGKESQQTNKNSDLDQVYTLCQVMEVCGGYDVLCGYEEEIEYKLWKFKWKKTIRKKGMPLPALNLIIKFLEYKNQEMEKSMKESQGRGPK